MMQKIHRTVPVLAAILAVVSLSADELRQAPVCTAAWFRNKQQLAVSEAMLPVDIGGNYRAFAAFDPATGMAPLGKVEITSVKLRLGIQYLVKTQKGNHPSYLEVLPLREPLVAQELPKTLPDAATLVAPDAPPLARVELTRELQKGDVLTLALTLPESGAPELFRQLRNGVALRIVGRGGVTVNQINFYATKSAPEWADRRMELVVEYRPALPGLSLAPAVRPQPGKYVTRRGNAFIYDGKPIRFSGVNFNDESLSYAMIDRAVERLRNMNINAIRLWAGGYPFYTAESAARKEMAHSAKGDGSKLDRYDYLVAKCQEAGIFIHNTSLGSHTPPLEHWPDLPVRITKKDHTNYDHLFYTTAPALPYVDPAYRDVRLRHIELYLNRVNPYTGQRYAEMPVFASWELANENHTVALLLDGRFRKWHPALQKSVAARWNEFLKKKYGDTAKLLAAWGRLEPGENLDSMSVKPAPIDVETAAYPATRGRDYVECMENLFIDGNRDFEAAARRMAPAGIGINTAPIVHNTHADLNLHSQYASAAGDTLSCGVYQTPFTTDRSKPFYPWKPMFSERPYFYNLNFQTSKAKPFIVYEHSFFRPYPYRAEWVPALTLLGGGLGWDALYLYSFGQRFAITDSSYSPAGFTGNKLPIPNATNHIGYTSGFHSGGDEVLMASLALASQAFLNGIAPNRAPVEITFGPAAWLSPEWSRYAIGKTAGKVPPGAALAGGEREWFTMPDIYQRFMRNSVRGRLSVDFDPAQREPISVKGEFGDHADDSDDLNPAEGIFWEPRQNRFRLDAPHTKLAAGILKHGVAFGDGFRLGPLDRDFAFFGISSRDGLPLRESKELILTLTGNSENTGYRFDPAKIESGALGHIKGVVDPGRAPVRFFRPAGVLETPLKGVVRRYNFAGNCYSREPLTDGRIVFSAEEPLFVALITKE